MNFNNSRALIERAYRVIPSAGQTFSKGPTQWPGKVSPNYLVKGEGAWVWDADGNKFLDYLMALGPISLGYKDPVVDAAIIKQLEDGIVFSQMHPLEVEVAELLTQIIPCADMVRFAKNGSDVTTAAVRAARGYTKKERVIFCGYHGWHDWYIGSTTRDLGVPGAVKALSSTFVYNDIASLEQLFEKHKDIAAVIMEPVGVEVPKEGFLEDVRALCDANNALLIFDEIVNGFRLSMGGGQELFKVTPDLACFGKGMANGMPLSAVVGKKEVMEIFDEIFFSGTFGGEVLSLAACKATIQRMQDVSSIDHIWRVGNRLSEGIVSLIERNELQDEVKLLGYPVRSVLAFPHQRDAELYNRRSYFMQECIKRGLLYFCSHIPCYAHGDDEIDFALGVMSEVMPLFADAVRTDSVSSRLEGECVKAIFRRA